MSRSTTEMSRSTKSSGATDEETRRRLGRCIRQLRTERRLTQETLAEKAGVTNKHLSRIERGLADARSSTLNRILRGLDINVTELFSRITTSPAVRPDALRELTESIRLLTGAIMSRPGRATGEPSQHVPRPSRRARRSQNQK
jgi:transcriptional regulator with XRE-family HTH domain